MKTTKFFEFCVVFMSRIITNLFLKESSVYSKRLVQFGGNLIPIFLKKQFAEFSPIESKFSKIISVE